MAAVNIRMDAIDEEGQRIKEEAYTRHLAAERAEADREMNAEYPASHAATVVDPPRSARDARREAKRARQAERAAMEERWRRDFPWAPVPAPVVELSSDEEDDMDDDGGDDA